MEKFIECLRTHRPAVLTFSAALVLAVDCGWRLPGAIEFYDVLGEAGYLYHGATDSFTLGESPSIPSVVKPAE